MLGMIKNIGVFTFEILNCVQQSDLQCGDVSTFRVLSREVSAKLKRKKNLMNWSQYFLNGMFFVKYRIVHVQYSPYSTNSFLIS